MLLIISTATLLMLCCLVGSLRVAPWLKVMVFILVIANFMLSYAEGRQDGIKQAKQQLEQPQGVAH